MPLKSRVLIDVPKRATREQSLPRREEASVFQRAFLPAPRTGIASLARRIAEEIDPESIERATKLTASDKIVVALREAIYKCISNLSPHRAWLAEIDRIARNADSIDELRNGISAYLRQAGIERIEDVPGNEEHFVVSSGQGDTIVMMQPAYVDKETKKTMLSGRARRIQQATKTGDEQ